MTKKYLIEYNNNGEAYFVMDENEYILSNYYYDGVRLYLDYKAYTVEIEYGIDDYIILREVR